MDFFIQQQMFDHGHVSNISIQRLLGVPYKLRMSPQQLHNTTAAAVHRIIRFMDPWVQGGPIKVWLVPFWEDRCTVPKIPLYNAGGKHWIRTIQTKSWPKTQNTVTLITCFFKFIWGCRVYYQVIFSLHNLYNFAVKVRQLMGSYIICDIRILKGSSQKASHPWSQHHVPCTRCQSQLHTKKNSARSLLTKQKCQTISSLVALLKMKIVIVSHSFTIFFMKHGQPTSSYPEEKNLSQVPDRKCSCSRLTPGSSAMEFMAEVASKKGRGGGFLNTQKKYIYILFIYIYIDILTYQWKPLCPC